MGWLYGNSRLALWTAAMILFYLLSVGFSLVWDEQAKFLVLLSFISFTLMWFLLALEFFREAPRAIIATLVCAWLSAALQFCRVVELDYRARSYEDMSAMWPYAQFLGAIALALFTYVLFVSGYRATSGLFVLVTVGAVVRSMWIKDISDYYWITFVNDCVAVVAFIALIVVLLRRAFPLINA